jgi:hypothetical protein
LPCGVLLGEGVVEVDGAADVFAQQFDAVRFDADGFEFDGLFAGEIEPDSFMFTWLV